MKLTAENLQRRWNDIYSKDGGFLPIETDHPLEWYIGYQSVWKRTLLILCDVEVGEIEFSKSIIVNRRRRIETDNRWAITIELLFDEQEEVFSIFCCDLIDYSSTATNEKEAMALVIKRYKQWSQLLESKKSGLMDEKNRKGLLGELLFLDQSADKYGPIIAIRGWVGPEGADQDFMYNDGWYEIKSIGASAKTVTISSLEQLDCLDYGELVIMRIEKVAPDRSGGISLNDAIRQIEEKISEDDDALELFKTKLITYGYINVREYSEQKYQLQSMQCYCVDSSFPRFTKKSVPSQIVSIQYDLDIPSLEKWQKRR